MSQREKPKSTYLISIAEWKRKAIAVECVLKLHVADWIHVHVGEQCWLSTVLLEASWRTEDSYLLFCTKCITIENMFIDLLMVGITTRHLFFFFKSSTVFIVWGIGTGRKTHKVLTAV